MNYNIAPLFKSKLSELQLQAVNDIVCKPLNLDLNSVLAVMYFETGKTFSPSKTNQIGSVGLIQFTRDYAGVQFKTINGVRYYLSVLKAMTFEQQLHVVYEYFKPYAFKINNYLDHYLAVFFPAALGKDDNFVLQTKSLSASLIATQNPIFNADHNSNITRKEVTDFFKIYYAPFYDQIAGFTQKKNNLINSMKNFITNSPFLSAFIILGLGVLVGYFGCKKTLCK